jgi:peptidyl-prolyl cis-trans isomerase A (cyclophilin A)
MFGFGRAQDTPAPAVNIPGTGTLKAKFVTSMGTLTAELFEKEAPRTVANFVALATGTVEWTRPNGTRTQDPLYNGTIFHRVIPRFMIQGGDPQGTGTGGPGYRWKDESSALALRHDRPGLLSMANAGPDTNGSQFFITEVPTPHLNGKHAVFGKVIEGVELIARITNVPRNQQDRPVTPVKLQEVIIFRE